MHVPACDSKGSGEGSVEAMIAEKRFVQQRSAVVAAVGATSMRSPGPEAAVSAISMGS